MMDAKRSAAGRAKDSRRTSRRPIRKYWAAACIGLAIAVTLWGFSYKLSRYNPHPSALSRASVAKFWDKHEDALKASAKAAILVIVPVNVLAQGAVPALEGESLPGNLCLAEGRPAARTASASSPVPLRSPPAVSFPL